MAGVIGLDNQEHQETLTISKTHQECFQYKKKIDLPRSGGHLHIEAFLFCCKALKNSSKYMDISTKNSTKLVACKL